MQSIGPAMISKIFFKDCANSEGSYSCCCKAGYEHNPSSGHCEPIKCPLCGDNAYCTPNKTVGADPSEHICECNSGYEGDPDVECTDIDECTRSVKT